MTNSDLEKLVLKVAEENALSLSETDLKSVLEEFTGQVVDEKTILNTILGLSASYLFSNVPTRTRMNNSFKTLRAFTKAIAPLVKKNRQNLILDTLERLGYVTKEITHSPYYKTSYKLRQGANPTQEDVEKVAAEANAI